MSKESEKAAKEFMQLLEEFGYRTDVDTLGKMLEDKTMEFVRNLAEGDTEDPPEDAYDYLELAERAKTKKKKLEYLEKARMLEPSNLDVRVELAKLEAKTAIDLLPLLEDVIREGDAQMEAEGYFQDCTGDFWGVFETRPYMRARYEYFQALTECGRMRLAVREAERMLELSENDNLGVRYALMHLYAFLEEEEPALKLHKRYDAYEETQMLLPLTVLYYKLGRLDDAAAYFRRLSKANKDTKKFFRAAEKDELDEFFLELSPLGYRPNTMDELLYETAYADYLFESVPHFFSWARKMK